VSTALELLARDVGVAVDVVAVQDREEAIERLERRVDDGAPRPCPGLSRPRFAQLLACRPGARPGGWGRTIAE
jgi:hypothetical protein